MAPPARPDEADPQGEDLAAQATAWLVRMRGGDAGAEDHRAFQTWLDRDPAHRAAYAEAEALWQELGGIRHGRGSHRAPPPARGRPERQSRRHRLPLLAAVAATLAVVAVMTPGAADRLAASRADHVTARGETARVELDDGSTVHLNTATALSVDYTAAARRVRLHGGEAFFTVTPDPARPFEVAVGDTRVRVLGTAFNVREEGSLEVAVTEGRVGILRVPGDPTPAAVLGAGAVARVGDGIALRDADPAAIAGWRHGRLVFTERPLREVVAELDRYHPGVLVLAGGTAGGERFSGVLGLQDTERALAALAHALSVHVIRLGPYLTILYQRG